MSTQRLLWLTLLQILRCKQNQSVHLNQRYIEKQVKFHKTRTPTSGMFKSLGEIQAYIVACEQIG